MSVSVEAVFCGYPSASVAASSGARAGARSAARGLVGQAPWCALASAYVQRGLPSVRALCRGVSLLRGWGDRWMSREAQDRLVKIRDYI